MKGRKERSEKIKAVFGTYRSQDETERAIEFLLANGYRTSGISILLPDNGKSKYLAENKKAETQNKEVKGTLGGGIIGGTLGLLWGDLVGALGGVFVGFGISKDEAENYECPINNGKILLSIHTDDSNQRSKAVKYLKRTGAENISSAGNVKSDWKGIPKQLKEVSMTDKYLMNEDGNPERRNI